MLLHRRVWRCGMEGTLGACRMREDFALLMEKQAVCQCLLWGEITVTVYADMEKELHETTLFPRKALRPMSLARLDNLFVCLCSNYSIFHWKVNMKIYSSKWFLSSFSAAARHSGVKRPIRLPSRALLGVCIGNVSRLYLTHTIHHSLASDRLL